MPSDPPVLHGDLQGLYDLIDERGEEIARLKRTHAMEVGGLREQLRAIQAPATIRLKQAYTERDPLWLYDARRSRVLLPQAHAQYLNAYDRVREAINLGRVLSADDVAVVLNELAEREHRRVRDDRAEIERLRDDLARVFRARDEAKDQATAALHERDLAREQLSSAIARISRPTGFARVLEDDD